MTEAEFKRRTRALGLAVIRLVEALPRGLVTDALGRQLVRSGTSVGANYRAACRSRSTADMLSRLAIVEEEADETVYWLEMLEDSGLIQSESVTAIKAEANDIVAMTVASIKTLRIRANPKSKIRNPK